MSANHYSLSLSLSLVRLKIPIADSNLISSRPKFWISTCSNFFFLFIFSIKIWNIYFKFQILIIGIIDASVEFDYLKRIGSVWRSINLTWTVFFKIASQLNNLRQTVYELREKSCNGMLYSRSFKHKLPKSESRFNKILFDWNTRVIKIY